METYSFWRAIGCFVLCFLFGAVYGASLLPVWGVVTLERYPTWVGWNTGCLVLLAMGVFAVAKVASRSSSVPETFNNRIDALVGSVGFTLAFGFVYLALLFMMARFV